ncbi:bark storage protein A-like [Silene latifolia]|uniref:bark storage protein A-like n=1 Tax=Silene latifolia TaxID=37657 RepID=UPI003D77B420
MAGTIMKLLVVVIVGLLFLVPDTMQLSVNHPLHAVVERLNKVEGGGYLALVISTAEDEILLRNSSDYQPDFFNPFIIFAGRTFNFGTFKYQQVVHVLAGKPLSNVAATVQMMIDLFPIKGIIDYGSAGTVSKEVIIADVVIPSQVAFTGVWSWEEPESKARYPSLKIGEYNSPDAGNNSLGHITSLKTEVYEPTSISKTYFFDVHSEWLEIASRLNFGERPTVLLGEGYRCGSSDIYVSNSAYGTFLNKKLNITIVDTSSAAVVATSIANGVPHIVIKGASNRPGLNSTSKLSETTKKNVLKTVSTFVGGLYWQSEKTHANVY